MTVTSVVNLCYVDAQCYKLVMVVGCQFVTLNVHLCVQRHLGLSVAAKPHFYL